MKPYTLKITGCTLLAVLLGACLAPWLAASRAEAQPESPDSATHRLLEAAARLERAYQLVEEHPVPVGTVIAHWGTLAEIEAMDNYEICDGQAVQHENPSKVFENRLKPDLSGKFIRGVTAAEDVVSEPILGGSDAIDLGQYRTEVHRITDAEMPAHAHPHAHRMFRNVEANNSFISGNPRPNSFVTSRGTLGRDSKYSMTATGNSGDWVGTSNTSAVTAGGGQPHSHKLAASPGLDNRPAFVGMYYIIRVR